MTALKGKVQQHPKYNDNFKLMVTKHVKETNTCNTAWMKFNIA
jgi:hypothetical protein